MKESFENRDTEYFKYPNIEKEEGEFDRVAVEFGIETSVLTFQAHNGELVQLTEDILNRLENTDANTFEVGDWDAVHDHSNPDGVHKRDWESLKVKMDKGEVLDAPIIMKFGDRYHLVSGNTRLMVSRAKGVYPKVLIFEVDI
jgi:hypothetical protein